jgi:hypothetical protein
MVGTEMHLGLLRLQVLLNYILHKHSPVDVDRRQRKSVLGLPVYSPFGKVAVWWAVLSTLMDLTYTAFLVPMSIGFLNPDWCTNSGFNFLAVTDLIGSKQEACVCDGSWAGCCSRLEISFQCLAGLGLCLFALAWAATLLHSFSLHL